MATVSGGRARPGPAGGDTGNMFGNGPVVVALDDHMERRAGEDEGHARQRVQHVCEQQACDVLDGRRGLVETHACKHLAAARGGVRGTERLGVSFHDTAHVHCDG